MKVHPKEKEKSKLSVTRKSRATTTASGTLAMPLKRARKALESIHVNKETIT